MRAHKRHFPTAKHTWRAAGAQQSRLIPLTATAVPTCVASPVLPQLGPMSRLGHTPGKLNLHRTVHRDQFESGLVTQTGRFELPCTSVRSRSRGLDTESSMLQTEVLHAQEALSNLRG